eukprot:6176701-Pleurochrysis_carterae.AAC.2
MHMLVGPARPLCRSPCLCTPSAERCRWLLASAAIPGVRMLKPFAARAHAALNELGYKYLKNLINE